MGCSPPPPAPRTHRSKLRVLQAQLHVAAYTSESVPALKAIAGTLAAEEEEARATIERVRAWQGSWWGTH